VQMQIREEKNEAPLPPHLEGCVDWCSLMFVFGHRSQTVFCGDNLFGTEVQKNIECSKSWVQISTTGSLPVTITAIHAP
jgi:hypothetical protein